MNNRKKLINFLIERIIADNENLAPRISKLGESEWEIHLSCMQKLTILSLLLKEEKFDG